MEEVLEVRDVHDLEWAVVELQRRKRLGEAIHAFGVPYCMRVSAAWTD